MRRILKIVDNVKKGPKTTVLGAVIILASIGSVFYLEYSWANVIPGLGLGALLFLLPDKKKQ